MKTSDDKNIEQLVEKMMTQTSLESPAPDFTGKVMTEVFSFEKKKSISYKPVISKRSWLIISTILVAFVCWIISDDKIKDGTSKFDVNFTNADKIFNPLNNLQISGLSIGIILFAAMMMFIQIIWLKSFLNKRLHK